MQFPQIRRSLNLVRPLGASGIMFACAMLVIGYGSGSEWLYRPLANGPSTHPLTATAMALLGFGILSWRPRRDCLCSSVMGGAALALGLLRLAEISLDRDLLSTITPFYGIVRDSQAAGTPIATGANTATMVVLMSVALILNNRQKHTIAQFFAFLALGFPLVSVTGYAYGVDKFYGRMALTTVVAALPVGAAILLAGAHRGVLRSVLSPWVGGRIARVQILLGYVVPFLIGYALLTVAARQPAELFGLLIVLVSAFISGLIVFSAVIQEYVDKQRRGAERRLALAATHDPLTDLPNRRLLFDAGPRELDRAARNHSPVSVLMVDIDNFKQLNDRFGHAAGDEVLRRVADMIRSELRRQDLPARYGGEEFAVLLPDTSAEGAAQLAEKLRRRIADEFFGSFERDAFAVTISVGCAENEDGGEFHQLLCSADDALYRAKAMGRNRVELADADWLKRPGSCSLRA
jgi:diguanylate cyclase (GGDEF)-like protein